MARVEKENTLPLSEAKVGDVVWVRSFDEIKANFKESYGGGNKYWYESTFWTYFYNSYRRYCGKKFTVIRCSGNNSVWLQGPRGGIIPNPISRYLVVTEEEKRAEGEGTAEIAEMFDCLFEV